MNGDNLLTAYLAVALVLMVCAVAQRRVIEASAPTVRPRLLDCLILIVVAAWPVSALIVAWRRWAR